MLGGRCNRKSKLSRITLDEDLAAPVQLHSYAHQQPKVRVILQHYLRLTFLMFFVLSSYDTNRLTIILDLWKQADGNAEAQLDHAKNVQRKVRNIVILIFAVLF
jgi:hypothetical protein